MGDFRNSVKKVMIVFLILFVALITYIAYFQAFKAPDIAADEGNKRIWAKRNEILRGTIYDRDGRALTTSEKDGVLTQKRSYVYGDLYSTTLGYINETYGLSGMEKTFDNQLTQYSSVRVGVKQFFTEFSVDKLKEDFKNRNNEEQKIGNSVVSTLDTDIQQIAYNALGNQKGAVVALNPKTGEVLCMVSKPGFDPNNLDECMKAANAGDTSVSFINRATYGVYPPGSTFKTITTASSLENISGVESRIFQDNGVLSFNSNYSLSNAGGAAHGSINLKQAFAYSSNVVYGTLALELGNDKLKSTAEDFGFNSQIDAVGFSIQKSTFPTLEDYEEGMIAQSGIGQSSIVATPMQMALVASTIANDGVMMKPRIVSQIKDMHDNVVKNYDSEEYKKVLDSDVAATIKDYMVNLVNSNGSMYYFNGYNVAGKTGTADHNNDDGSAATPHSWFIGFAPADDPKVAVAVIVENGGYGAQVAAPIAGQVITSALSQ